MSSHQQLDPEIYDDEAFVGMEEGEVMDGRVVDDLNEEDAEAFEGDDDEEDAAAVGTAPPQDGPPGSAEDMDTETPADAAAAEAAAAAAALPDAAVWRCTAHTDGVMAVAWSPDGNALASGGCDDHGFLSRWRQGDAAVALAGHEDTVACVAFDSTGDLVATGGMDGCILLWHAASGAPAGKLEGPAEAIEFIMWHPKGKVLVAGSEDMTAWLFNAATQQCMHVFSGHTGPVVAGGFTPDGRTVVTAGGDADGSVRTWNPKSGECSAVIPAGHNGHSEQGCTCLAISDDSALCASGGVDGTLVLSSVVTGKAVAQVKEHDDSVEAVAFAHSVPLVVSCSMDGRAVIWDITAGARRGICMHPVGVICVAMQPSGPLFATGALDGVVRVFDVRTGQEAAQFGGHTQPVQAVVWSPDQKHLASGSDDHSIRVFEVAL